MEEIKPGAARRIRMAKYEETINFWHRVLFQIERLTITAPKSDVLIILSMN